MTSRSLTAVGVFGVLVATVFLSCMLLYTPAANSFSKQRVIAGFQNTTHYHEDSINSAEQQNPIMAQQFLSRRLLLKKVCSSRKYDRYEDTSPYDAQGFFSIVAAGRLEWCRVAKVGTTFMKGKFYSKDYSIFSQAPPKQRSPKLTPSMDPFSFMKPKSFFFVREPYSRLVAGFLDKVMVTPDRWLTFGRRIVSTQRHGASEHEIECGSDATFQEFVQFVVQSEITGKYRDNHFMPMHAICGVCRRDFDFVGHLETINDDLDYILSSAGVDVTSADMGRNVTRSIESRFRYVFLRYRKLVRKCMGDWQMMRRLWWHFQARGIIHESIPLQASRDEIKGADWQKLAGWVIRAHLETKTFKKEDIKKQKHSMAVKLLLRLPLVLRLKFAKLYAGDFELFGYEQYPADIFPELATHSRRSKVNMTGPVS